MDRNRKKFDCVEMKRQGAAQVRHELEGMTKSEQLAYWQKAHRELLAEQEALREARRTRKGA